ncbi:MAG: conjugal transfer protein TraR [Ignavibacteria bacterium]
MATTTPKKNAKKADTASEAVKTAAVKKTDKKNAGKPVEEKEIPKKKNVPVKEKEIMEKGTAKKTDTKSGITPAPESGNKKETTKEAEVIETEVKDIAVSAKGKKNVQEEKQIVAENIITPDLPEAETNPQHEYPLPIVEITSPKKNVRKVKGYSKVELENFKKIILEKRSEIIDQLQNLRDQMMDPATGQYVNENSPYSLHMAEQGTDAMEREKVFLWAQRENKFLSYLEDALHRIENGTYGICIDCIDEPQNLCPSCPLISKERLIAVPHSQLCLPVKAKQEKW